jgi:hypothetical protein
MYIFLKVKYVQMVGAIWRSGWGAMGHTLRARLAQSYDASNHGFGQPNWISPKRPVWLWFGSVGFTRQTMV